MRNNGYFQFRVSPEQIKLALEMADDSIRNHPVSDIYAHDRSDTYGLSGIDRQRAYRFTGTLGEILFADIYGLKRPTRAFGAVDGQDNGRDFKLPLNGRILSVDLKTMRRNFASLKEYYVLDLPSYQIQKNYLTDCYFHITLIPDNRNTYDGFTAAFVGYVLKDEIDSVGEFFPTGSLRKKDSGNPVLFSRDTYEVKLGDLLSPPVPNAAKTLPGFAMKRIYF